MLTSRSRYLPADFQRVCLGQTSYRPGAGGCSMRWNAACTIVRRSSIERRRVPKPHPMKKRKMAMNVSRKLNGSWPFVVSPPELSPVYVEDGALEEEDAVEEDMMFVSALWAVLKSECVYRHRSSSRAGRHEMKR